MGSGKVDEKIVVYISLCVSFNLQLTKTEHPRRFSAFKLYRNWIFYFGRAAADSAAVLFFLMFSLLLLNTL